MRNYFNYFTEIEEHFQARRGSLLLLSTLDWSLIESWREAGVPLEAVLRGIDSAFQKRESAKAGRASRRVNGLAWCAQAVMEEAEAMRTASVGSSPHSASSTAPNAGFEPEQIAAHLETCAAQLHIAEGIPELRTQTAHRLTELASTLRAQAPAPAASGAAPALAEPPACASASPLPTSSHATEPPACNSPNPLPTGPASLEDLERTLSVLEERLLQMLLATAPEPLLVSLREQAARELAPFRARMSALQARQIEQQFLAKRLLEHHRLPRLSLFYMAPS